MGSPFGKRGAEMGARTEKPHDRLYDFSCIGPLAWSSSERAKVCPSCCYSLLRRIKDALSKPLAWFACSSLMAIFLSSASRISFALRRRLITRCLCLPSLCFTRRSSTYSRARSQEHRERCVGSGKRTSGFLRVASLSSTSMVITCFLPRSSLP